MSNENTDQPQNAGVIAPPPLLALAALVAGVALSKFYPLGLLAGVDAPIRWIGGGLLVVLALLLELSGSGRFLQKKTPVQPWRATRVLVTDGIFRFVRNPMYVGFFLILAGIAIIGAFDWLLVTTLVLMPVIHWGVVKREERYLTGLFGADYAQYMRQVRRYGVF